MKIKNLVMRAAVLAACTFGVALSAHAQGMGGGGGQMSPADRTARQVDMMKTNLSLTDDQVTKVKAIYADRDKQMADLRASGGDMETMRPKMQEITKGTNDKIKMVLTDDQKKKFDDMQSQMMMRGGGGGRPQQ